MSAIEERFKAVGWSKLASSSDDGLAATWGFKGDQGEAWTATFKVASEAGSPGTYVEHLLIDKVR